MRRLEYTRRIRSVPGHARNAAEAVMVLAHVARERHRLEQERRSLAKRMHRIDARLTQITGEEIKLVPAIQALPQRSRADAAPVLPVASLLPAASQPALPAGVRQVTLQY